MKSRWVEAVRRGVTAASPRGSGRPGHASPSTAMLAEARRSAEAENPAFVHLPDRCESAGDCSVARVLENCVLQGGVHHTHMNMLTYLGRPLRQDLCCYPVSVQWFRAFGEHDDFQVIPGACDEFFTPSADDIGARILAKVMIEDEDVVKTKMLEYGPIKEDPEVRSKVEMYLERKSVLFMGLQSVAVRNSSEYPESEELRESWTLLIDDRRVRLTCESSLLTPFESLYTREIKLEVAPNSPNEFCLFFRDDTFVRLRAESNLVRDIIVLTLRAFCAEAVESAVTHDAVARGLSPMLTLRTLAEREAAERLGQRAEQPAQDAASPAPSYDLPWSRSGAAAGLSAPSSARSPLPSPSSSRSPCAVRTHGGDLHEINDDDSESFLEADRPLRKLSLASVSSARRGSSVGDEWGQSLLLEAEALIGHASKIGLQHQILPREPKRISILDVPDLQIIEAMEGSRSKPPRSRGSGSGASRDEQRRRRQQRRRRLSAIGSDGSTPRGSVDGSVSDEDEDDGDEDDEDDSGLEDASPPLVPPLDPSRVDDAIREFVEGTISSADVRKGKSVDMDVDVDSLRSQYAAIFVALQRELRQYKQRAARLAQQLDEKRDENASFRCDIDTLQDALRALQASDKMYELVASDLRQKKRAARSGADSGVTLAAASKFFMDLSAVPEVDAST